MKLLWAHSMPLCVGWALLFGCALAFGAEMSAALRDDDALNGTSASVARKAGAAVRSKGVLKIPRLAANVAVVV